MARCLTARETPGVPEGHEVDGGAPADENDVGVGQAFDRRLGALPQREDHRADAQRPVGGQEAIDVGGVVRGGRGCEGDQGR